MQTLTTAEKTTQLMVTKKEYPENYGWWISELNSLGVDTKELREASDTVLPEHSGSIIILYLFSIISNCYYTPRLECQLC